MRVKNLPNNTIYGIIDLYKPLMLLYIAFPVGRGFFMPKSREKTRANKKREKLLDKRNAFGFKDPTPYNAVKNIRKEGWQAS
jgi:hypothetical protein